MKKHGRIIEEIFCWTATIAMFFVPTRELPLTGQVIYWVALGVLLTQNTRLSIRLWREAKTQPRGGMRTISIHLTWPMVVVFIASIFAFIALLWYALRVL